MPSGPSNTPAAQPGGIAIDLLALAFALVLAWWKQWSARDLVWSLWLSSLLVGYATLVLTIFGPLLGADARADQAADSGKIPTLAKIAGGLFMLAFFTVHFGGFHFVHSVFLNVFFPVVEGGAKGFPTLQLYGQVFASYWPFVLAAAVSERQRLATAMKATHMMGPYKNVIRMHLLIFFFAGAAAVKLDTFVVYAVVLLVYFFPFHSFRRRRPSTEPPQAVA